MKVEAKSLRIFLSSLFALSLPRNNVCSTILERIMPRDSELARKPGEPGTFTQRAAQRVASLSARESAAD